MKILTNLAIFVAFTASTSVFSQSTSKPAAEVNGETITEARVRAAAAADLKKLEANPPTSKTAYENRRLEIMWKTLDAMIADKVIGIEAEKSQRTKKELTQIEVDSDLQAPPEQLVTAYYDSNKSRFPGPRAAALERVKKFLADRNRQAVYDAWVRRLRQQYHVKTFMDPLRKTIQTAGFPSKGPASAPITIVEFSDFECPYCNALLPSLQNVEKNYGDKVRIVYRQFPLPWVHPHAEKAAEASLCADQQKHFWEFHDALFANQRELTPEALKKRAADMKLDMAAFNACLDSGKMAAAVTRDIAAGHAAGVTGTPTVFINGRMVYGTQAYYDLKQVIDDELQRKGK